MIKRKIIPVVTIYHYGGFNRVGNINLSSSHTFDFFKTMGKKIFSSNLIPQNNDAIIFSNLSLSNTLYNESFMLAKYTTD